jgi:Ca2+-binding RTX toxin-like protein
MHGFTPVRIAVAGLLAAGAFGFAANDAHAAYSAQVEAGTLLITGDSASESLAVRLAPGSQTQLDIDVGNDGSVEASFDRGTFTAIDVAAGPGADEVFLGPGLLDELVTIDGGPGDDTLRGSTGDQTFHGGPGDDFVAGGDGDDHAFLGSGDDRFAWNPGDDNDAVDGGSGADSLEFNGANVGEQMLASADGSRVRFTRNVANIVMDLGDVERLAVRAFGGADAITIGDMRGTDLRNADIDLAANGGAGDGQPDSVIAQGTDGADAISFDSSNGSIAVDGLAARTSVAGGEAIDDVTAQGLAGEDSFAASAAASEAATMNADGGEGADTAHYDGTPAEDTIAIAANGAEVTTAAPAAARFDVAAVESLVVRGLAGADSISSVGNLAALTALTLDGGDDADTVRGGNGADLLLGGKGDDFVDGNQGADRALLGGGDDRFQWDPGDGSDSVEGQAGQDALDFFGSNIGEEMRAFADGKRVRFTRNVGNIVMDLDGIEQLGVRALGGADQITVDDLRGTELGEVDLDLAASGGGGDGQPDTVIANGADRKDKVQVSRSGSQVAVAGLAARLRIGGSEPAGDLLRIQTFAGNDDVSVAPDVAGVIATAIDLGADE